MTDVPALHDEVAKSQNGAVGQGIEAQTIQRGSNRVRFISRGDKDGSTQQPTLFDFTDKLRRKRQLAIEKLIT